MVTRKKAKFKVPKETKDVKFYDKEKYERLLLSPYEFRVGDRVVNTYGNLYTILEDLGELVKVKHDDELTSKTHTKATYSSKRVVLRPLYIPPKKILTEEEKKLKDKRIFIKHLAILFAILYGGVYTDLFMRLNFKVTAVCIGFLTLMWFIVYATLIGQSLNEEE